MAARATTLLLLLAAVCLPAFAQKTHLGLNGRETPSHRRAKWDSFFWGFFQVKGSTPFFYGQEHDVPVGEDRHVFL